MFAKREIQYPARIETTAILERQSTRGGFGKLNHTREMTPIARWRIRFLLREKLHLKAPVFAALIRCALELSS